MNLQDLKTKELLIKDFYIWLFDDSRISDKAIDLIKEVDLTLARDYLDPNIYFPRQIANLLDTTAFKRLGRISHLGLANNVYPNLYHNRLEHSKGVYNRKLEEMLYNFQNPPWKKYIEDNNMKLYLLAELIKMLGHDIGHLPFSHAMESKLLTYHGAHEVIGQRIMLEDPEIQSILNKISPELPNHLKSLYNSHILNFKEHDESNLDVDRHDYICRDNLYFGTPCNIPYEQYESISKNGSTIDVYKSSSLPNIENLLELRRLGYEKIYSNPLVYIREACLKVFVDCFEKTNSSVGINLRNYINYLKTTNLNEIDLSEYIKWDDISFYSEILDIIDKHEDMNIRLLAAMCIPNIEAFLNMMYSHLQVRESEKNYSPEDKIFLQKLKRFILSTDELHRAIKQPNFIKDNTLVFSEFPDFIEPFLISSSKLRIKAYKSSEPIHVKDDSGEIYELSEHPNRNCDWDKRNSETDVIYAYIPYLKLNGVSDEDINRLKDISFNFENPDYNIDTINYKSITNMQPLQTGHSLEDTFLEL